MSETNPRERLAEAVKAYDGATECQSNHQHVALLRPILAAARALLAAPDDAAEKNLAWEWLARRYRVNRSGDGPLRAYQHFSVKMIATAPDPVALAAALGRKEGE